MSTQAGTLPNKTETVTPAASKEGHVKLSWREKICYGFGDFGNGFMFDLGQAYLTKYWIDVCTIPAAAVAGIFAFTKIFDAFMDPIAGSVIDGRKNIGPRGKFRPVMMASAVILAILTVITFTMPDVSPTGKILFAYGAYMAWGLVYSFTNIPYSSLASVMTRDVEERSQMATTRQAGSIGAQLITGMAFVPSSSCSLRPMKASLLRLSSCLSSASSVLPSAISTAMNTFRSSAIPRMNRKQNSRIILNSCLLTNRFYALF